MKSLKNKEASWKNARCKLEDIEVLIELGEEMNDSSVVKEVYDSIKQLKAEVERMRLATLLKGEYDSHNAIISIHAGAGAQKPWIGQACFTECTRWCEQSGWLKLIFWEKKPV